MPDLWYPNAASDPGPAAKVWPTVNSMRGVILHSMEGYWPAARAMLMGAPQVSWHYSILQDGQVLQAYPLAASCWHAGSRYWNERLIGIEHEGRTGEPLTRPQQAASVALVAWVAAQCGWAPSHATGPAQTLWAHADVSGANTTCPNGRIPWVAYMERELNQGERIALVNDYAAAISAGSTTHVYVDDADPANLHIRIVTPKKP